MSEFGNLSFNVEDAKLYGVDGATFLFNLRFWIHQNQNGSKQHNYKDGKYWAYWTHQDLLRIFPFWTKDQLRTIISNLKNKGAIEVGCYNPTPFLRTRWYTLGDALANGKSPISMWEKSQIRCGENPISDLGDSPHVPYTDNNHIISNDSTEDNEHSSAPQNKSPTKRKTSDINKAKKLVNEKLPDLDPGAVKWLTQVKPQTIEKMLNKWPLDALKAEIEKAYDFDYNSRYKKKNIASFLNNWFERSIALKGDRELQADRAKLLAITQNMKRSLQGVKNG